VQALNILLLATLGRHKAHAGPLHRFTNRFGINGVIFIGLDVGLTNCSAIMRTVWPNWVNRRTLRARSSMVAD